MKKLIITAITFLAFVHSGYSQEKPAKVVKDHISKIKKEVVLEEGKDPICKMHVEKDAKHTSTYQGKKVSFCSIVCKEMFDKKYAFKPVIKH